MTIHKSAAVQSGIMPDHALAGNMHFRYGIITTADDDMVSGDTLEMVPIPEGARIIGMIVKSDTDIPGADDTDIGDGTDQDRFFDGLSLGAANRQFELFTDGKFAALGYKYTTDDTIDIYLQKAATKVPTGSVFEMLVWYNMTGTISDES